VETFFVVLFLLCAVVLTLLVLIQRGRGGGLAGAFGGAGGSSAFGTKTADVFVKATAVLGGVLFLLSILALWFISPPVTPKFMPKPGQYTGTVKVSIESAGFMTSIHYTTDGSEPTSDSPAYSGPLALSETTPLRARAYVLTRKPSEIAAGTFTISTTSPEIQSSAPVASAPAAGGVEKPAPAPEKPAATPPGKPEAK
jgi:preprotein translocase subunit SecG